MLADTRCFYVCWEKALHGALKSHDDSAGRRSVFNIKFKIINVLKLVA